MREFRCKPVSTLIACVLTVSQHVYAGESGERSNENVRVDLVHEQDITLRLVGPSPQLHEFTCTGPCARSLAPGVYRMYAHRGNEHWPADWLYFWEPQRVEVRPPNRGAQTAGRVMLAGFGGLFVVSYVVFVPTVLIGARCGLAGDCTAPWGPWVRPTLIATGIGMGASIVPATIGLVLVSANRNARVRIEPLPEQTAVIRPRARLATSSPLNLELSFDF